MSIVSFYFILFLILTVIVYYLAPKKFRWITLLIFSVVFFVLCSSWKLFIYIILGVLISYFGTNFMPSNSEKNKKIMLVTTIMVLIGTLAALKWINIIPMTINVFAKIFSLNTHIGKISLLAPLGVSYYTLSLIGYNVDVYRGAYEPEKNIFKLALFICYYPILVSGPFVRYSKMKKELFEEKSFSFDNIILGFERIIYGIMKKVVIADNLALFVNAVFDDYASYSSYYIIIATVYYAIQIYCDFSGCMDIVIGASKMYGITLDENFDSPFLSRNLSEFWRRWHISLGLWGKDYIMYPLLKSEGFQKMGTFLKNKLGKKAGKMITTFLAILILWLFIGIWHGSSFKYIFCAGILPWIYLVCGEVFEGTNKKICEKLKIRTECFSFELFRVLRTIMFMCIIWFVACSPSLKETVLVFKRLFIIQDTIFFETLPQVPHFIMFVTLGLVFMVDYFNYRDINLFEEFRKQNVVFQYIVILTVIFIILMHGIYGPGYNAADFIYGGF